MIQQFYFINVHIYTFEIKSLIVLLVAICFILIVGNVFLFITLTMHH